MAGLMNVGFGNMVNTSKVTAVINPDGAPVKRMIQSAKTEGILIDATQGRKTKSVIVMVTGQIVLSALQPDTITKRFTAEYYLEDRGDSHEQ